MRKWQNIRVVYYWLKNICKIPIFFVIRKWSALTVHLAIHNLAKIRHFDEKETRWIGVSIRYRYDAIPLWCTWVCARVRQMQIANAFIRPGHREITGCCESPFAATMENVGYAAKRAAKICIHGKEEAVWWIERGGAFLWMTGRFKRSLEETTKFGVIARHRHNERVAGKWVVTREYSCSSDDFHFILKQIGFWRKRLNRSIWKKAWTL